MDRILPWRIIGRGRGLALYAVWVKTTVLNAVTLAAFAAAVTAAILLVWRYLG